LADFSVIVLYWKHLDGALHVSATFALVLANANGMILLRVSDVKVDLNAFAIFSYWMGIVLNVLWPNACVIHRFALRVIRSMFAIVIKLTNDR
jgi:hypothetical protein